MEKDIQPLSVELTIDAQEDIRNIYSFIEIDSQKYALILVQQFLEIFEKLKEFPNLGKNSRLKFESYPNIKEIRHKNYRIFYTINTNKIIVLNIIHSSRNIT